LRAETSRLVTHAHRAAGHDPDMTRARQRTGEIGERIACKRLEADGWLIIERNARTSAGEIDAIAMDASTLVFVEVKTMRTGARSGPERPILAVGPRKQLRVRRLARAWLAGCASGRRRAPRYAAIRFDAIGVSLDPGDRVVTLEHIRSAF
jgi:putative endonuclease